MVCGEEMIELSDNDKKTIEYKSKDPSTLAVKVLTILSGLYKGLHNTPWGTLDKFPYKETFYIPFELKGSLATTDFNTLTRLVFMAHDLAIRVEIVSTRKHCTLIYFHERVHCEGDDKFDSVRCHPTLEQAVKWWRNN